MTVDRKHLNIDQRQGKTPMMHLVTAARIAGGSLTWLSMLISMVNIVLDQWGA
jgi:hypothetical protein